jgi:opacity protein-like surface antigen
MYFNKLAAFIGLFAILASALNAAENAGLYFRLEAGPQIQQNVRLGSIQGLPATGASLSMDTGARFDLVGGYQFCDWFALEAEAGMLYNSLDKVTNPSGPASFEDLNLWQVPIMLDAVFTIPLKSRFKPYFGIGVGELWSVLEGHAITKSHEDYAFAYQGQAGVHYNLNEQMNLGLGYKFLASTDHDLGAFETKETYSHSLLFQLTFKY